MSDFLYIYESKITLGSGNKLYSLSAIHIPSEIYSNLRQSLYEALNPLFNKIENTIAPIPELHYRDFLPEYEDDDFKIEVFKIIVEKLIHYNASVFRVGYYDSKETAELIPNINKDEFYYQLCWLGIQSVTSNLRKGRLMMPVVDAGFERSFQPRVNGFGYPQKFCDQMPKHMRDNISIDYSHNIAEVSFVDSRFSMFAQLIDCISGMRNETLRKGAGEKLSDYKQRIYELSSLLDQNSLIVYEDHIVLNNRSKTNQIVTDITVI